MKNDGANGEQITSSLYFLLYMKLRGEKPSYFYFTVSTPFKVFLSSVLGFHQYKNHK